jgi:stress response protein YsnF
MNNRRIKRNSGKPGKVTKEPIKETKTVQVPLTHEEVTIEISPPSGDTKAETPVLLVRK